MSTSNDLWATDLAEAWDKGYLTGYQDRRKERDYDPGQNPYRAAAHTDEETRAAMGRRRHLAEMTRQAFTDGLYETSAEDYAEALRRARGKNPAATTEDAAQVIERAAEVLARDLTYSTGWDAEANDAIARTQAEALAESGLLATARTRPTRDEVALTILGTLARHFEVVAGQLDGINAAADAVLALFRGDDE